MSDVPDLYRVERQDERAWAVIYTPEGKDDEILCYVLARDGQDRSDAKGRAMMIADVMNATRDMVSFDIRDLLEAYEEQHGFRHHSDWRDRPSEGGEES